jgi:ATP-dependent Clp protease ATP-binding subunit ClpA
MLERFTTSARTVVEGALGHARTARASRVLPEHLFSALLDQRAGLAVQVLTELGAPPDQLRQELETRRDRSVQGLGDEDAAALAAIGIDLEEVVRRLDLEPHAAGSRGRPRFSREAKKVLELSLREAIALQHGYIGTEHLLLGLVRAGDPLVRDVLVAAGLTQQGLRTAVAEAVRKAG